VDEKISTLGTFRVFGVFRGEAFSKHWKGFGNLRRRLKLSARLFLPIGNNGLYFSKDFNLGNGTTVYTENFERLGGLEGVP